MKHFYATRCLKRGISERSQIRECEHFDSLSLALNAPMVTALTVAKCSPWDTTWWGDWMASAYLHVRKEHCDRQWGKCATRGVKSEERGKDCPFEPRHWLSQVNVWCIFMSMQFYAQLDLKCYKRTALFVLTLQTTYLLLVNLRMKKYFSYPFLLKRRQYQQCWCQKAEMLAVSNQTCLSVILILLFLCPSSLTLSLVSYLTQAATGNHLNNPLIYSICCALMGLFN